MIVIFQIHYRTIWDEEVRVVLPDRSVTLHTVDGYLWGGYCEFDVCDCPASVSYHYEIYYFGKWKRSEWHVMSHSLLLVPGKSLCIYDDWRDIPSDSFLYTSAFPVSHDRLGLPPETVSGQRIIMFRATCSHLPSEDVRLAVVGSHRLLGEWDVERALPLYQVSPHQWACLFDTEGISVPFEYKFIMVQGSGSGRLLHWETAQNRQWQMLPAAGYVTVLPEVDVQFPQPAWRAAGVAIPLFSLRSEGSCGVGDFGDLKKLVDWVALTHQKAIQILPVNDTTMTHGRTDSYPYSSISIYALHPMYMDIRQLGSLKDRRQQQMFERLFKRLNAEATVDYERVNEVKRNFLRHKYEEDAERLFATDGYKQFFAENRHWLQPYAAYSYLRDQYGTPDFRRWPRYAVYVREEIERLCAPTSRCRKAIAFHYYVQYLLHVQLSDAAAYARRHGVILKGDIPIGVSRTSVEAWTEPHYFNLDGSAGAPPDQFSTNGQNWGFPTYDWERMSHDGYHWWKQRLSKMAEYFTAYRIDHILGFFRIWEIPTHSVHGLLGQFAPALPMSPQEIESFGLPFRADDFTRPFINEAILHEVFEHQTAWVKDTFVRPTYADRYEMRPEFATQRQVQQYFRGKNDTYSVRMRDGLYQLISNVLFVPDRRQDNRYHPRIDAAKDRLYKQLTHAEQQAFDRLHEHYFYHRHNEFWYHEAMKKLPVLTQATSMLACGEDLGMIPACVPRVMDELRILTLEIERMPKDPRHLFGQLAHYPYRSVCTLSTHDTSTLRGWWEEVPAQTEHYYRDILQHDGETPAEATPDICQEIVTRQLACPSMLCILTFQDWMSIDAHLRRANTGEERINVPANPHNYWNYRMHLTLEELLRADEFNRRVRTLIDLGGRTHG